MLIKIAGGDPLDGRGFVGHPLDGQRTPGHRGGGHRNPKTLVQLSNFHLLTQIIGYFFSESKRQK